MQLCQRQIPKEGLAFSAKLPVLGRLLAARGVFSMQDLAGDLSALATPDQLMNAESAARYLIEAIRQQRVICVVADFDCDGATACAVAVRGLRALGARVEFRVPDRQIHGYGLTPSIVEGLVLGSEDVQPVPEVSIILTVDNGISSFDGVARARELGLDVVVTDHHLASPKGLPDAVVIVNPNQPGCPFPSKALAGVGVIWYVLWAMQRLLRAANCLPDRFLASQLLPLVAVGTVADVVPLDKNNRTLISHGLQKIHDGVAQVGIQAILEAGFGNSLAWRMTTQDIAFGVGPRINAAGRLADMSTGIACLLTDDKKVAAALAEQLIGLNSERQTIEREMVDVAMADAEQQVLKGRATVVVHDADWHQGVIGIVAGRIKERHWRPTFALTTTEEGEFKGSGRSVPGVHLKDLLDWVDKHHPGLLKKFGGHAMAAGLTLAEGGLPTFILALEQAFAALGDKDALRQVMWHDGPLTPSELTVNTAKRLRPGIWGQAFPAPLFQGSFTVKSAKLTGATKSTLKLVLVPVGRPEEEAVTAVRFRYEGVPPMTGQTLSVLYELDLAYPRNRREQPTLLLVIQQLSFDAFDI